MFGCIAGLSSPLNDGRCVNGRKRGEEVPEGVEGLEGAEGVGLFCQSFSMLGCLSLLILAVFVFQGCEGKKKEESDSKKSVGGAEGVEQDQKVGPSKDGKGENVESGLTGKEGEGEEGKDNGEEGKDKGESETGEKEGKGGGVNGVEGDEGSEGGGVLAGLKAQKKEITLDEPWKTKKFDLVLSGPKELVKGKVSKLMLTLTARKPYKANKLFPFELKIEKVSQGLEVKKKSFKKKDASLFSDGKVVYEIEVKGVEKGEKQVLKGKYKFSVCTVRVCETPVAGINVELATKK